MRSPSLSISSRLTCSSPWSSTKSLTSVRVSAGSQKLFSSSCSTPWSSGTAPRLLSMIWQILALPGLDMKLNTSRSAARVTMLTSNWSRGRIEMRRQTSFGPARQTQSQVCTAILHLAHQATRLVLMTQLDSLPSPHTKISSITWRKRTHRPSNNEN